MGSAKVLTISIAAYNTGSSLQRTLDSLECNEDIFDILDILIIDDGSSDSTPEIAGRFSSEHPSVVRVIRKDNGGYGSTVNTALKEAKGLYFKLLDGDDAFDRDGLEGLVRYIRQYCGTDGSVAENAPDIVISPFYYEDETGRRLCDRHRALQTRPVSIESADFSNGLMMFELCVRTDVLKRSGVRLTEHCFYTDNEFVMASELYSGYAVRYPFPVYRYSIGVKGQSMSIEGRRRHYEDKINAARGVFSLYSEFISCGGEASGSRKLISDSLLSTMVREVYMSLMIQKDPSGYRSILKDFDKEIACRWPYVYEVSCSSRLVSAARSAGMIYYPVLCGHVLRSESARMGRLKTGLRIAEYLAAACMIIQCRTVYMHLKDYGMIVNRMVWIVMIAALAVCIIRCSKGKSGRREALLLCAGFAAYAALFILVNPVNYLRVIRCASAVIVMLFLVNSNDGFDTGKRIVGCYRDIMVVVAAVSLFFWISGSVFKFLPCTGYCYMDWSATGEYVRIPTFLGMYFETQWTAWDLVQARNSGIFVEAPMAGCAYSIAMLSEYISQERNERKGYMIRIAILTAAILSTLSLIAYGFLLLFAVLHILTARSGSKKTRGKPKYVTTVLLTAGAAVLSLMIVNKLRLPDGNIRLNDFSVGFHAWLAHPFFGGGFESLEYLQQFMPEWRSFDIGFSNSPMEILGQGGIYLAVPYIYAFISTFLCSIKERDMRTFAAAVLFAYVFIFNVIPYQYITFFILTILWRTSSLRYN